MSEELPERTDYDGIAAALADATGESVEEFLHGAEEFDIQNPEDADWEYIEE